MAGTISNRKVARAARTGGGRRRSANTSFGWYALLTIVVVLGSALVWTSRADHLDAKNPGNTHPLAPVPDPKNEAVPLREGDHWYEALGLYICDKYVPNINNSANPYGISTNNDGVIHISPFEKKYAGHNSTLGLFDKAVGLKVTRNSVQVPGDPKVYGPGAKCGDKDGELVVKEWTSATDEKSAKVIKANPQDLLLENNHALAIAFVPVGTEQKTITLPPSSSNLTAAAAQDSASAGGASGSTTPAPASTPPAPSTPAPAPAPNK